LTPERPGLRPLDLIPLLTRWGYFADGILLIKPKQRSPAREQGDKSADYFTDPYARGRTVPG